MPFDAPGKFASFFKMLPGVEFVRPELIFYDQNSDTRPGFESQESRRALVSQYQNFPVYRYAFDCAEEKIYFVFSYEKVIVNAFERNAWVPIKRVID